MQSSQEGASLEDEGWQLKAEGFCQDNDHDTGLPKTRSEAKYRNRTTPQKMDNEAMASTWNHASSPSFEVDSSIVLKRSLLAYPLFVYFCKYHILSVSSSNTLTSLIGSL